MAMRRTFRFRAAREVLRVLVLCVLAQPAAAHDFWISPEPMDPQTGQTILLRLYAGEWFQGDEVPYEAAHALRFQHFNGASSETLTGREGFSPASFLRSVAPGVHLVSYTSAGTDIQVEPEKFNRYLEDSGLSGVLAYRRQQGQSNSPAHERFFRYAKALIVPPGAKPDLGMSGRVLGQRLEIVPEFDPVAVASKRGAIRVRVLYEGKPLAGGTVFAMPRSDPQAGRLEEITDASGRAAFVLDQPGVWMVKLVWMVPGTQGAEWESSWGSLVFLAG
jgi:uncharacterized GH25 family protein